MLLHRRAILFTEEPSTVTVTFIAKGTIVSTKTVAAGGTTTLPSNPTRSGWEFYMWTPNGSTQFNASSVVNSNMTIYARWRQVQYMGDEECSNCSGTGTSLCTTCYGYGTVDCGTCGGYGQIDGYYDTEYCLTCGGSGMVMLCGTCGREYIDYPCYNCGGTNFVEYQCWACDGVGSWEVWIPGSTCGSCNGTGDESCGTCGGSGLETCSQCNGSGEVAVYDWVYENY